MTDREHGTIVSWNMWGGTISADNGDRLKFFYWSVLRGFRNLKPGQRVEFWRGVGLGRKTAELVKTVDSN